MTIQEIDTAKFEIRQRTALDSSEPAIDLPNHGLQLLQAVGHGIPIRVEGVGLRSAAFFSTAASVAGPSAR